jgi:hypothetical protein
MSECHSKALALSDCIMNDASVPAKNIALFIDIVPFPRHRSVLMIANEIRIILIGNKTDLLGIGF